MTRRSLLPLIVCAGLAQSASAQVIINEVLQNPPGDASASDSYAEYIELYGTPGMSLDGYAVACVKGGTDTNDDNIPEAPAEIDEAFTLDGLTIGANGFLVLYNGTTLDSFIPLFLPPGANGASFIDQHVPSTDTPGKLSNDDSSTYLLVRRRAATTGPFPTAFRKDIDPDVDFDGKLDFGIEIPTPITLPAERIDPLQIIDELAWSDNGGKEYVRDSEQEISNTPGFNPDAVSRVAYYYTNPMLGFRLNSQGLTVETRMADEEFVYGETDVVDGGFFEYNASFGAPTDPAGDGFADINAAGLDLTPGDFNDDATLGITQFRFTPGDLNFDGCHTNADVAIMDSILGRSFDETEDYIDPDTSFPIADPNNPGNNFQSYVFQGRLAQSYLAALDLDKTDGPGGANEAYPTAADRAALVAMICPADVNCDGTLNLDDVNTFAAGFISGDLIADVDGNGSLNLDDVNVFAASFIAGCP
ncbi:MAG: GC-type dockerin domain-anchored protein [Phycisphaerales bacterium]